MKAALLSIARYLAQSFWGDFSQDSNKYEGRDRRRTP